MARIFKAVRDGAALPYTYTWDCGDSCHCSERTDLRIWHFPIGTIINIEEDGDIRIIGPTGPWGSLGDYPEISPLFFEEEEEEGAGMEYTKAGWEEVTDASTAIS